VSEQIASLRETLRGAGTGQAGPSPEDRGETAEAARGGNGGGEPA